MIFQHHLIPDWPTAFKTASMRLVLLGAAIEGAFVAFPDMLRDEIPEQWRHWIAIFCFVAAAYGRITRTQICLKEDDHALHP